MHGIYTLFSINTRLHPEKAALVDADDTRWTYRKLGEKVNSFSHALSGIGVHEGMRVGFLFRNGSEFVITYYAILKLGAVAVPFATALSAEEVKRNLARARCRAFICDGAIVDVGQILEGAKVQILVSTQDVTLPAGSPMRTYRFGELLASGDSTWDACVERHASDDELILFTSGSTGEPKCVVHSHEGTLMFFSLAMMSESTFRFDDVMLYYAPLYHLAGMSYLMYILSLGATLVLRDRFDPESVLDTIEREHVTQAFIIPPTLVYKLHQGRGSHDLGSMRWVILSGGASGKAVADCVFELFPNAGVSNTYGQSERCANTILLLSREEYEKNPGLASSVGHATQFSEIRLIGEDGREGDVGEAWARCPGMFKRYEGLQSPFKDGWFPTGDMLRRDQSGNYWFVDRAKDMIKTGGENVFSLEVEQVVNELPAVAESAVFGLPDRYFDEAVSVAVVLSDEGRARREAGEDLAEEIVDWCRHRMAGFKRPRNVFFVDALPKNSLGKVQKGVLRERYWHEGSGAR